MMAKSMTEASPDPTAGAVTPGTVVADPMASTAEKKGPRGRDDNEDFDYEGYSGGRVDPYDISGIGIHEENARNVVGGSIDQRRAGQMAGEIAKPSQGEAASWGSMGNLFGQQGKMAGGQGMSKDPGIQAARNQFNVFNKPMIDDSFSAMGLGRSADKMEAQSLGLAQMMQPATQDFLRREGEMINRDVGIAGQGIQGGLGLANQELTRQGTAFDAYSQTGDKQRAIAQEQADAPYNDFMRRAALGEQSLTGPFGGMVPSTIGSSVTSSGGK